MFGLQWSVDVLAMVIIGGIGLRYGPVIGAVFVVLLGELLADYPELHVAITGVILIVLIRFAPKGLAGWRRTLSICSDAASPARTQYDRLSRLTA